MGAGPPSDDSRKNARRQTGEHGQFVTSSSFLTHTLPEGTRIGGLEITGLIGEGGFGIVYLAYDESLDRDVAIKEYMPSALASRAAGSRHVTVKSEHHRKTFEAGLKSFVNEARLLARFDHPSLLKVYTFWEANGTAYMAMPYYVGKTLKATLAEMPEPPDEACLRSWLMPLLDALEAMHQAHCYHRDIAPDNILLTAEGPILLDFGAARRVIGDMTQALTVVLKHGYAPIEQYGDTPDLQQGAWTDLYALACVVRSAITGQTPMSSVERLMRGDPMEPLSRVAAGRYSVSFLQALDAALAIQPRDRPQDVAEFRALLDADPPAAGAAARVMPAPAPAIAATPVPAPAPVTRTPTVRPTVRPTLPPASVAPAPPHRRVLWIGAAVGALGLAAAAMLFLNDDGPRPPSPPAVPPAAVTAPAPAAAPAAIAAAPPVRPSGNTNPEDPAPTIADTPARPPTPVAAPAPAAVVAPVEATPPPPPPPAPPAPAPAPVPAPAPAPATADAPPARPAATPVPIAPPDASERPAPTAEAAPPPRRSTRTSATAAPAPTASRERCSDILQKASLEPLSAAEAEILRKECR